MKKNLLQVISVVELMLLVLVGILSNKIAELFEINQTFLWVFTLITVTILAVITIYKSNPASFELSNNFKESIRIKVTKKTVGNILQGIIYYPSVLALSMGVFQFSKAMEKDWHGTLSGCIVSGVLIFAPLLLDHVKEEQQSTLPITIGFILSCVYGLIGMYIGLFPEIVSSHIVFLTVITAITLVGVKYVFVYYTLLIPFAKWYKNLPDK